MNVTNDGTKNRQLHKEGYLQMVSAEQREYAEAFAHPRITEINHKEQLIQEIKEGKFKPNPVRRVEIPKETKGEFRKLGVPTVVDRYMRNNSPMATASNSCNLLETMEESQNTHQKTEKLGHGRRVLSKSL